jgi:hypothetical protein
VQGVYVVDKDKNGKLRAKFVPVTTGITGATDIEVLTGLTEGQEIVTGPYKTLRAFKNNALVKRDTAPTPAARQAFERTVAEAPNKGIPSRGKAAECKGQARP